MIAAPSNARSIRRALLAWHGRSAEPAPWRESRDPYRALIAATMAQQTQMSRVLPAYERFVAAFPSLDSLAAASAGDVIRAWRGMGYNRRAVRLHRAARHIVQAGWPHDAAAMAEIEGIGSFTAAIVASFAFDQPVACIDTNVRRVLGRIAGDEKTRGSRLEDLATAMLARRSPARWNQALMDYGARVCTPRPRCSECVVSRWCATYRVNATPRAATRAVSDARLPYVASSPESRRGGGTPFEHSARYFRGRIIDALCDLRPGRTIAIEALRRTISGSHPPDMRDVRRWVEALAGEGLLVMRRGRVSLP
jgi:A/G-specific adenine glycosylase